MQKAYDKIWEFLLRRSPEFAVYNGIRATTKELDSFQVETIPNQAADVREIQAELAGVDYDSLGEDDQMRYLIVQYNATTMLTGLKYESYLMPVNFFENPVGYFLNFTMARMKLSTYEDYAGYCDLIASIPQQLEGTKETLRLGVKKGMVRHVVSVVPTVSEKFYALVHCDIEENRFYSPFLCSDHQHIDREFWEKLQEKAKHTIQTVVNPSLLEFRDFLAKEYETHLRTSLSINSLPPVSPGLPSRYQAALQYFCDVDWSPHKIHEIGLQEVKKLQARIQQVMERLKFAGNLREFTSMLNEKPEFCFKDEKEVLHQYEDYYKTVILPKIQSVFKRQSNSSLTIKPVFGHKYVTKAMYSAPSGDFTHGGVLLVYPDPAYTKKYEIPTLMLHEAEPGHHMQACYALQNPSLPKFMKNKDDRRYYEVPGRFKLNAAYTEGWGLYSEELGEELGFYEDDYDLFGYLSSNLGRSARVVVDTGIHAFGWSVEQATQYMLANTAMSELSIQGEIDRYITWPGQACSYKIGHLEFTRLRRLAENKLGSLFDIQEFHHECLWGGQVPMNILDKIINKYIDRTLQQATDTCNNNG